MAEIHGTSSPEYARLGELLSETVDSGEDVGASVSVTVEGETVVDIWGGWADEAKTTPWDRDTITNVWSTTKTMTFLCTLLLAERGLLDYHEKVATYWPEFAQNGKADIEVRHHMAHTSGVSAWEQPVDVTEDQSTNRYKHKQRAGTATAEYGFRTKPSVAFETTRICDAALVSTTL